MNKNRETVSVVGAGSIGVAWAVVFLSGGYAVTLYDLDSDRLAIAPSEIRAKLTLLEERGLIPGNAETAFSLLRTVNSLNDALVDATFVQECGPENLEIKKALFAQMASMTGPGTILATSSSAITASRISGSGNFANRTIVVHPLNPPFLLRVAELVSSSATSSEVIQRSSSLLRAVGIEPIVVGQEIEGFLFNRLQGALLREAYCLVRDGVASPSDVDKAVSLGLGRRWAILGVFETVDRNTRGGIAAHAERMGPAYARMGADRGQDDPWTPDLVERVAQDLRAKLAIDRWQDGVDARDERLADLAVLAQERWSA